MAQNIETDPTYRVPRLLGYRDAQANDLCAVLDAAAIVADDLARDAEGSLLGLDEDLPVYAVMRNQAQTLRRLAAHFRREVENTRRHWAIKQAEERA